MQSLEKRLIALEAGQGSSLSALTDEELDARITALGLEAESTQELAACIARLKTELSMEPAVEACHAEH